MRIRPPGIAAPMRMQFTCSATTGKPAPGQNISIATALFRKQVKSVPPQVLLVKRGKQPNMGLWALPGGRLDDDETLFDGALRELVEETGISQVTLLPQPVDVKVIPIDGKSVWKLHVFAGYQLGTEKPFALSDAADTAFFSPEQLRTLNTVEGLETTVNRALLAISENFDVLP